MDDKDSVKNQRCASSNDWIVRSPSLVTETDPTTTVAYHLPPNIVQKLPIHSNIAFNCNQHQVYRCDEFSSMITTPDDKPINLQRKDCSECKNDYRTTFTKSHYTYLYRQIRELYIHTRVLDVYFLVGRQYIGAHFCILAYASPLLKNLLLQVTGDSMFISVPDVSSIALENLIYFLYNGSLKHHTINFEEVREAAKYLGMEEVVSLLKKYNFYFGSNENNSSTIISSREKIHEKTLQNEPERSCQARHNKLEEILNQRLAVKKPQQSEAHCSSIMGTGILSELLSKPDYNRAKQIFPEYKPSNSHQSSTPINLSKAKTSSFYNFAPNQPISLSQSVYLGCTGTLPEQQYFNYFNGDLSAFNFSSQSNKQLLSSYTPFASGRLGGNASGPNSTKLKEFSSNSKSNSQNKDSDNSLSAGKQIKTEQSCGLSSQQAIPYYNPNLLKDGCIPIHLNPHFSNFAAVNSLDPPQKCELSTINLKEIFPHLFSTWTNQSSDGSEKVSAKLSITNISPRVALEHITSTQNSKTALNRSVSSASQNTEQLHSSVGQIETRPTDDIGGVDEKIARAESEEATFRKCNAPSTHILDHSFPSSYGRMSPAQPSTSTMESSHLDHIDNYTETATSSLSPTVILKTPLHLSNSKTITAAPFSSYELLKGLSFNQLGIPFNGPSNVENSLKQPPISENTSAENMDSSSMDGKHFSKIELSQAIGSTLRVEEANAPENLEIGVVDSLTISNSGNREYAVSTNDDANLQSTRSETKCHYKDLKPETTDGVEMIKESLTHEEILGVQRRPPQPSGNMGRKRKGCGECGGCQVTDDCGSCRFCLDKSKYGGPNRLKQVCLYKRCSDLHNESNGSRKKRRLMNRRKYVKCGVCHGCQTDSDCGECYSCLYNNTGPQPPSRKKSCEMRLCEVEEAKAYLNVAKEPSPYSTDSLLTTGTVLAITATSDLESDVAIKFKMKNSIKKKLPCPYGRDSPSKVRTKYYCGKCPGCTTISPCGDCVYCEDMPKFGGRGRYRQKCIKQLCDSHPRLQALKNSNRHKSIDGHTEDDTRQRTLFEVNNDQNSVSENCVVQSGEDTTAEQSNCEVPFEATNSDPSQLNNLILSTSDYQSGVIPCRPLDSEKTNFKPISKLHIKKCDEEFFCHWQIQSIPVNIDKPNEYKEKDKPLHTAINLCSSSEKVESANIHEKDKNITAVSVFATKEGENSLFRKTGKFVKKDIFSNTSIDKISLDGTQQEDSGLTQEVGFISEKPVEDAVDSYSEIANPTSTKSSGRGRGKGKISISARGGRKHGRRRKTTKFITDPEDHSDIEDSYTLENNGKFENVLLHSCHSRKLMLRERHNQDLPITEVGNKENSKIFDQTTSSGLHNNLNVADVNHSVRNVM